MTFGTRRIVVDDVDPRIHYQGKWETENGAHDSISLHNGPTYEQTQHGTVADGASLSFAFNGSSIQLFGSWDQDNNETLPTWDCFIDSVKIEKQVPFAPSGNQNPLCTMQSIDGDTEREHLLTVNVTVSGNVQADFWVDSVIYTPFEGDVFNHTTMWMRMNDSAIDYDVGWADIDGARLVDQKGASLTAKFNGTSIRMVGPIQNASQPSTGTYTIDDRKPSTFTVDKTESGYDILFSQTLFESGQLDGTKEHSIKVAWQGNPTSQQKFGIENFFITTPAIGTKDGGDDSGGGVPVAAIIGAAVGGLVLLLAIGLGVFFWRRRRAYSAVAKYEVDLSSAPFSAQAAYDPYTPATVPKPTGTGTYAGYSESDHPSSVQGGSVSGPSTSTVFNAPSPPPPGLPVPPMSTTTTLSPPPIEQSTLAAMKNEQSYAVSRAESSSHSSGSGSGSESRPTQYRKHEDSGLRIHNPEEPEVVELPPDYVAS